MKKIILMAAFVSLGLVQTSCDKDDDKYELPAATLLGKWTYAKEGEVVGGVEILSDYDGNEEGCSKDYILFNANNTYRAVDFDSFDSPCEELSETGTYAVTGNTIALDYGDETDTAEILNLSYTELKVKSQDGYIMVFTR